MNKKQVGKYCAVALVVAAAVGKYYGVHIPVEDLLPWLEAL